MAAKARKVRPSATLIVLGLALLAVASFLWDAAMNANLREVVAGVETSYGYVALTGTGIGIVGLCLALVGLRRLLISVDLVARRLAEPVEAPARGATPARMDEEQP